MRTRLLKGLFAVLCASAALATAAIPKLDRVMVREPPKAIADFELTDQDGKPFAFSRLQGKPALVFFGFTNCPQICPTILTQLQALKSSSPKEFSELQVVLVSIDGERDTPAAMKTYLAKFSPDFIGLTGPPPKVNGVAAKFAAVFYKGQAKSPGDYDMQHTSQTYAVDRSGQLRAEFYGADVETMKTVVRVLLAETVPSK
jgi:protein SCO1/2